MEPDCRKCRYWKGNGGIDCDPDEEDFTLPCDGYEEIDH